MRETRALMTKIFTRYSNLSPIEFNLTRDDSGTVRHYIDQTGTRYISVTAFLSKFASGKKEIENWIKSIGPEEANKVLKAAGNKGTVIHKACENLVLNKESEVSMFYRQDFFTMKKHLIEHVDYVFATEHQMYSKRLMMAGTTDLIAEYNGLLSVIDYKTSNQLKYITDIDNYFYQEAAYAIMVWERYGLRIDQLVILMVVEGDPKIHVFIQPTAVWGRKLLKLRDENQ